MKVREEHLLDVNGVLDASVWLESVCAQSHIKDTERPRLEQACRAAYAASPKTGDDVTRWGEGYTSFSAGIEMAVILADLQMDADTLVAAILYRSVREGKLPIAEVRRDFGVDVVGLVEGVQRMASISTLSNHGSGAVFGQHSAEQAENVRKMLVAMVDDVRIALIKLAERTCAIRAVKLAPAPKRKKVANEVADIYAPLAHRLGIGHIKWELEDLSFRYLQPFDYKYIAKLLDEKRLDRQDYINEVIALIQDKLAAENIAAEVYGRAKHIYSIWRKMRRKNISFSEVYDIRAVRILVKSERDCYSVLGIVHALWRNVPNEFDDYIANPKENGYRSLHTAVKGPSNRVLEIQIRTQTMHEEAEYGVCAHWRYKGTGNESDGAESYEKKIEWLRQVLEWHDEVGGSPWEDHFAKGIAQDRIYVFTPEGHVLDLPENATPVDFAFRIHSDVGLHCRGAKVNGRIVPLNHALNTADQVEILTGKRAAPSRDWLNSGLGYVTTSKGRSRLHQWFKEQDRDQNVADGRALMDHEFKRLALKDLDFEALAQKLSLKSLEDLYAAVGTADLSVEKVIGAAQRLLGDDPQQQVSTMVGRASNQDGSVEVYIDGVGNLMSNLAQCCKPIPGDSISGYITLGKGVSIHREDCSNLLQRQAEEPERIIEVGWAEKPKKFYAVSILVEAFDRHGLLRDITTLLDREKVNVSAMKTQSYKDRNIVEMHLTVEIPDLGALSRVFAKLNQLPNIMSVNRQG